MRKTFLLVGLIVALVIPAAALAASLDTSKFKDFIAYGDNCDKTKIPGTDVHYQGAWYHFVLNQVGTDYLAGVKLQTTFDPSGQFPGNDVGPTAVLKKVQHFDVFSPGKLTGAMTVGADPGSSAKLVLSGVVCGKKSFPQR